MTVGIFFEVRDEFVKIARICLERTTGGKVDTSNDLIYSNTARHITAFVGLLVELIRPMLVSALYIQFH